MSSSVITVKIAGPAGTGIKSSGVLLSQMLIAHGCHVRDYSEYPSLVRGGHNTYQVSFSSTPVLAPHQQVDLFFSLAPGHWRGHKSEFSSTTLVYGDDAAQKLPLKDLAAELGGSIYSNTICLGLAAYLLNLDLKICRRILIKQFSDSSPNHAAFNLGFDYAATNFSQHKFVSNNWPKRSNKLINYDGNEAFGWGFIQAKGDFFAAYPMTPASGALHFLANKQTEFNLKVIHPEDEISAASLAVGAAFAGARSATGTSGGGFALMTETISFCGVANLGVVFYLVSRPGPATGLPTWTAQGDLLFAINSGHGEFNKIVIAPGDQLESFSFSASALNLAAKFNLPVIVLSDKFISESGASLPDLSAKKINPVLSTRPLPGTKGQEYLANSYEHDDRGFSIEDSLLVKKMVNHRQKVARKILSSLPKPVLYGSTSAKKLIIGWGSTKSTILETLRLLDTKEYAFLQIRSLWPLDPNLQLLIKPFKEIIVIENNATAQLVSLLKSQFDFNPSKVWSKFDGRPFFPEELIKMLKSPNHDSEI